MDNVPDKALYKQWPNIAATSSVYLVHCFFWMLSRKSYRNLSRLVVGALFHQVIYISTYTAYIYHHFPYLMGDGTGWMALNQFR